MNSLPLELVIIRHGESEGNLAAKRSRKDNHDAFTDEYRNRHSSMLRLTDVGIQQAQAAGNWLAKEFSARKMFDRFYASEYLRALETAGHLGIPKAHWFPNFYLRERDWGELDNIPMNERLEIHGKELRKKNSEPFHWRPPGGESKADVCLRLEKVLATLARECSDGRAVLVCHGEVMWAFRVLLERISQDEYKKLDHSKNPHNRMNNCQILHYSRRHPETGDKTPFVAWKRSICPWDTALSTNEWEKIDRKRYSNEELLTRVGKHPRLVET